MRGVGKKVEIGEDSELQTEKVGRFERQGRQFEDGSEEKLNANIKMLTVR